MKHLFSVLILLTLSAVSFGQSIKAQLEDIDATAGPLLAKREENKKAYALLSATAADIKDGFATLDKYSKKYDSDKTAYDLDLAAYAPAAAQLNSALDSHNANRCTAPADNPGVCASYNAEADNLNARRAQLQPTKDKLDRDKQFLDTTLGQLRELQSVMQEKYAKFNADAKEYDAQNNENEAKIKALADRWNALIGKLKGNNDACFAQIPPACQVNPILDDKCEKMHAACGAMFDGN
jgi:chromosome segregation ATPase